MDTADPNPAEFQGRRRLDRDRWYPQRPGGGRLRPVGPVLCYGHFPERRQLSGLPAPGVCPAALYPLHSGKGGRGQLYGDYDRYFQCVRRDHRHDHVRYGRLCLHGGHPARRDNGMAVHWTADFQYADPHRACQGGGAHCEGDVRTMKR